MTARTGLSAADVTSEAEFQASVIETARALGWRVYHTHDSRRSDLGYPDLTLVRSGVCLFMELKREDRTKAKESPEQTAWRLELDDVPGIQAYLFRPSDMPRIRELLDATQLRMEAVG